MGKLSYIPESYTPVLFLTLTTAIHPHTCTYTGSSWLTTACLVTILSYNGPLKSCLRFSFKVTAAAAFLWLHEQNPGGLASFNLPQGCCVAPQPNSSPSAPPDSTLLHIPPTWIIYFLWKSRLFYPSVSLDSVAGAIFRAPAIN